MKLASDEWRRQRLAELAQRMGGKAALGRFLGYKDGAFVRQMISGERPITEKTIRAVQEKPGLGSWFTEPETKPVTTIPQKWDDPSTQTNVSLVGCNKSVPRLLWSEVREYLKGMYQPPADRYEVISSSKATARAFMVEVEGDSMVSSGPGESLPAGTMLVCDPCLEWAAGDIVIAMHPKSGQPIARRLVQEAGVWFLQAINAAYPMIEIDDPASAVVAKAIQAISTRDL